MQTLERIETTDHCIMGFFENTILFQQLQGCTIILTLSIVLEALTFLDLDENVQRCQLLLHMSYSVGKEFINADDVMMAAPDRIMTSRYHRLHRQVEVGVLVVTSVTQGKVVCATVERDLFIMSGAVYWRLMLGWLHVCSA